MSFYICTGREKLTGKSHLFKHSIRSIILRRAVFQFLSGVWGHSRTNNTLSRKHTQNSIRQLERCSPSSMIPQFAAEISPKDKSCGSRNLGSFVQDARGIDAPASWAALQAAHARHSWCTCRRSGALRWTAHTEVPKRYGLKNLYKIHNKTRYLFYRLNVWLDTILLRIFTYKSSLQLDGNQVGSI